MPTYDYQCSSCSNVQEEIHSFKDSPVIKCNECGSSCEKSFSVTGSFILKGSGWPSTDARFKQNMAKKNEKMKLKMTDKTIAGESVSKISDLKK